MRALFEDRYGMLWVGTRGGGVSRFDGVAWTTFTTDDGLASDGVLAIREDEQGRLWFAGGPEGVSVFDGEAWITHDTGGRVVFSIEQARDGSLWFGTNDGALHIDFDGASWTTFSPVPTLLPECEDREGGLWFSTEGDGAVHFDGTAWTTLSMADGLPSDAVQVVYEDRAGTLWVGTDAGVSRRVAK